MNRFLKWSLTVIGVGVSGVFAFRAVQRGRDRLRKALGRAEAVADRTRAALEETQTALHETRTAI